MHAAMLLKVSLLAAAYGALASSGNQAESTCKKISTAISQSSGVFWPGSTQYIEANDHWALSSSQASACAVEPGTPYDLSTIVKILGDTRTQFGVKSGGHATNPGFSSTTGVQISLSRFSNITYNGNASTVGVGSGLIWDDVYAALENASTGANVIGARVKGIGLGGFSTGGGYSWKSNQYGLTVDTVVAYDLVQPDGTFVTVTSSSHPDLFWGLKGGFNNFGIVTGLTLKTFPQTEVWGGSILFASPEVPAMAKATAKFTANNTDPKASLITTYNGVEGQLIITLLLFYDGPVPPAGIFDDFLAIPSLSKDISTRSFASLVQALPSNTTSDARGTFHTVSLLSYSENLLNVIANQSTFWESQLQNASGVLFSYDVEPFFGFWKHATPSAYPHNRPLLPLNLYFAWLDPSQDEKFISAIKESARVIYEAALAEGQDISIEKGHQIRYPNYALWDTPLEEMYGSNVDKLRDLRARYDPHNVMSLTGGFRF